MKIKLTSNIGQSVTLLAEKALYISEELIVIVKPSRLARKKLKKMIESEEIWTAPDLHNNPELVGVRDL